MRGKGVSSDKLTIDAYERMYKGEAIKFERNFAIKRMNIKLTAKQRSDGVKPFSLRYLESDETSRVLNRCSWQGRIFLPEINGSVPLS